MYLVAGVANRDARAVAAGRVERMKAEFEARGEAASKELGDWLFEASQLGLWRAMNVTAFESFVEDVLALPLEEARGWLREAELRRGSTAVRLRDEAVAVWMRTEAAFVAAAPSARAWITKTADEREWLHLELPVEDSSKAIAEAGRKHAILAADRELGRGGGAARSDDRRPRSDRDEAPVQRPPREGDREMSIPRNRPPQRPRFDDRGPPRRGPGGGGGDRPRFDDRGPPRGRPRSDDRDGPPRGRAPSGGGDRPRFDDRGPPRGRGPGGDRPRFDDRGPPRGRPPSGDRPRFDDRGPPRGGDRDRPAPRGGDRPPVRRGPPRGGSR